MLGRHIPVDLLEIGIVLATVAQCLERARQCEWSASLTNDEVDRKFLLWKAQQWMKLGKEKERQAPARICAKPKLAEEVKFLSANDKTQSPSGDTRAQMCLLCLCRLIFDILILRCFSLGERCRSHYLSGSEGRIAFRVQ
jgi:hypothetical protein